MKYLTLLVTFLAVLELTSADLTDGAPIIGGQCQVTTDCPEIRCDWVGASGCRGRRKRRGLCRRLLEQEPSTRRELSNAPTSRDVLRLMLEGTPDDDCPQYSCVEGQCVRPLGPHEYEETEAPTWAPSAEETFTTLPHEEHGGEGVTETPKAGGGDAPVVNGQCQVTVDCPEIECEWVVGTVSTCRGRKKRLGLCRRLSEQEPIAIREPSSDREVITLQLGGNPDEDTCPQYNCVEGQCVRPLGPYEEPETEAPTWAPSVEETLPEDRKTEFGGKDDTETPKTPKAGGDPHFRTWSGTKFDYHGECDLVLLDHPQFANNEGLRIHIRTTRIKYFSYIDTVVVQIGDNVLEFANDVDNFLINGKYVEQKRKHQVTMLGGYVVRRDTKALSIRLDQDHYHQHKAAHIDLYHQKSGFPTVKLDAKDSNVFEGSQGLLGDYATGRMLGRDGTTEMTDATEYALEWQVSENEPMLFNTARFPQAPTKCVPPSQVLGKRLGDSHMKKMAEQACSAWGEDKDECIFDVMATRDVSTVG